MFRDVMEKPVIAVMGASGRVGGGVARLLLDGGHDVRVFGRSASRLAPLHDRGAGVAVGDAGNRDDLCGLLAGVQAALLLLPEDLADPSFVATRTEMAAAIGDAVEQAEVPCVVALSAHGSHLGIGPMAGLAAFEQRLEALPGTDVLILRCAWFMENLLPGLAMIREQGIMGGAIDGDRPFPMIATADAAREAAERLVRRDFAGHATRTLLGPAEHTLREATALIGRRLGIAELPYVQFPADDVRGALLAAGVSEEAAALLVDMMLAIGDGRLSWTDAPAPTTTSTTLEEFLTAAVAA